jgi:hypothetical protein
MTRRGLVAAAIITTVLGWAPLASVALAAAIGLLAGCRGGQGAAQPCLVAGIDIGDGLYAMGVTGWLMLATAPIAFVAIGLWVIIAIRSLRA